MKKENLKNNKAITLISLVITIIVLLILAIVSISLVINGGIIEKSEYAKQRQTMEQIEEKIKLKKVEMEMAKHESEQVGEVTVKEILENHGEDTSETVSIASGATSIPANMPSGEYYLLTPDKYASNNNVQRNISRYARVTSRGEERASDTLKDIYVINENLEIYYVIEGKVGREEITITSEKDLTVAMYQYNTMYNPNQPEIISVKGYYDDENGDRMSDFNSSLGAYIYWTYFDIDKSFFEQAISKPEDVKGNITAKITHLDGTVEEITLATTDNEKWIYEKDGSALEGIDITYIGFRPFAKHKYHSKKDYIDRYEESSEYHYMYIEGEVAVPFYKLEMLGKTMEFPYNCQAMIGCQNFETEEIEPMYNDINNVSKITVNFSDSSNKVYLKEEIFEGNSYAGSYGYSSQSIPVLYADGMFVINMPKASLKTTISSVIVEENGIATKYNVSDSTMVVHMRPGS